MELSAPAIETIFKEIDTDKDGYITRQDLETTEYPLTLFGGNQMALNSFNCLPQGKMNLTDFTMLCYSAKYNLYRLVLTKFSAEQYLNKYLLVSAPGEAAPSVKQSYIRLKAHTGQESNAVTSIGVQLGVDKPHQEMKIKQVTSALGHPPHEVFVMLKLKVTKNGEQLAQKIGDVVNTILEFVTGIAVGFEELLGGLKAYTKYYEGYVYLIVEVDNPLIDMLISFATQVIESISPECACKFKGKMSSNVSNLLTPNFDYFKSGGQVLLEFDIDHVTLKKIKQMMGDALQEGIETPMPQILALLFQSIKMDAEFSNLGQALTSAFQVNPNELPKPAQSLQGIKQLNIKENVESLGGQGTGLVSQINQSCESEGEFSVNFHDFFLKFTFDLHIKNAFDLIS